MNNTVNFNFDDFHKSMYEIFCKPVESLDDEIKRANAVAQNLYISNEIQLNNKIINPQLGLNHKQRIIQILSNLGAISSCQPSNLASVTLGITNPAPAYPPANSASDNHAPANKDTRKRVRKEKSNGVSRKSNARTVARVNQSDKSVTSGNQTAPEPIVISDDADHISSNADQPLKEMENLIKELHNDKLEETVYANNVISLFIKIQHLNKDLIGKEYSEMVKDFKIHESIYTLPKEAFITLLTADVDVDIDGSELLIFILAIKWLEKNLPNNEVEAKKEIEDILSCVEFDYMSRTHVNNYVNKAHILNYKISDIINIPK